MKKKVLAAILAAAMVFSLAACGSEEKANDTADAAVEDAAGDEEADDAEADNADDDADAADDDADEADDTAAAGDKTYIVATDTTFAPFEFENESGDMVGIDMDLLNAIAEDQGFEIQLEVLGFSAAVTALESGQVDAVIAGMSITDERQEKFDFSDPYYDSGVGMAVQVGSDIASYADLEGLTVAAKVGTEGCDFAESIAEEYGFTVTQFEDSASMYQDVLSGNSAACFEDYPIVGYEISRGMQLTLPLDMEQGSSYGFAVQKGENTELIEMFNAGLANLKESGTYDEILDTYISE